jgi:hypothetical protein
VSTPARIGLLLSLSCMTTLALADPEPPTLAPVTSQATDDQPAPPPLVSAPVTPDSQLHNALSRFEFGDYAAVVAALASLINDGGARALKGADRLEALRAYGIACVLVGRPTEAEGAFLLLLEADPTARLDARLVRPEAVAVFDAVRIRARDSLLAAYRKGRGRRYAVLNLLPPAGQLQNRQYKKGYALLGVELALLGLNISSGSLLYSWHGSAQNYADHESAVRALRPVNWVSFGALIGVVVYGIIDGFVVGHRRSVDEKATEQKLRAHSDVLSLDPGSLALRF